MMNSDFLKRFSELPPKRQALLALDLQNRLNASEQQRHEPIAVVAMGCRFPGGVNTPEAYWELLMNGVDAITEVPPERWDADANFDPNPDAPGKIATRWGGFLKDVDQFDPQLFGISPREAVTMDPQQRLLLEVCWETFERAGYAPDQLNGKRGGVFVGLCNGDYYHMVTADGSDQVDMYLATGSAHSVASGRISYLFGLQGPAVSIDTACSSSLVAIHMAIRSLRDGECDFALAGGVNLVLSLDTTRALSRAGMMASDGRCKAFDSRADGFVRSEGCGMVLLKPLSKALADHDPIIAVVHGSAANQDGRSNGLTAPNGPSQENVIRAALADAQLEPADVAYVETHGTGTSLGDPIEVQALGAAYGSGRSNPLLIGSVKTNMGHMESAAGVAGFMKLALVLQHKYIPPHLHLDELNPYIPWDQLPISVPTDGVALPEQDGKSVGAISSFGFSGTNAHIILASWSDSPSAAPVVERPAHILPLSAHNERALHEIVARWEAQLAAEPDMSLADAAHTAGVGRAQLPYRLALVAADANEARAKLSAFRVGEKADGLIVAPERGTRRRKIAFLFSGQGSQAVQMGRQLYETQPVFRDAINRCDELLRPHLDISLLSILYPDDSQSSPIQEITYAQPAQFAIEYALATLWHSWGIEPGAVAGHSIGEYAAACIAGIFSLEDALKMVAARGRLMQTTAPGEMAAVFADETTVKAALVAYAGKVSIAALNAPEITVISGEKEALASVISDLKGNRIRAKRLEVSIAAHSLQMESILKPFSEIAAQVQYHAPELDFYSALTGNLVQASEIARPEYWIRHLREPVRFAPVMQNLYVGGYHCFIENGPAPELLNMAQRTLPEDNGIIYLPSLRPGTDDWQQMLNSLGFLYVNGVNVDWRRFDQSYQRHRLILPTYPFQRERYWFKQNTTPMSHRNVKGDHPLLGERLRSPGLTDIVFQTELSANWPSFLDHHRIYGVVILPSPAYIEMVLTAAHKALDSNATYSVTGFSIHEALVLSEENLRVVQVILSRNGANANFQVLALNDDGEIWKLHASGVLVRDAALPDAAPLFQPAEIQARCSEMIDGAAYYERIRTLGLEFGSSFQGVSKVWRRDGEALGQISLPSALTAEFGQYLFHPALLDSCFHLLGAPLSEDLEIGYLLIAIDSFRLFSRPGPRLWNHTVLSDVTGETFTGEIRLYNEDGSMVAEATGLHLKRAGRDALMRAVHRRPDDWFYQVAWEPRPSLAAVAGTTRAEFASPQDIATQVGEAVQAWTLPADFDTYADVAAAMEEASAAFIVAALLENGVDFHNGRLLKPEDLTAEQDYYRQRLLPHLLNYLVKHGILAAEGDGWRVVGDPPHEPSPDTIAELASRYPGYESEIELLGRCGLGLPSVLQGDLDPLSLLFPEGSFEELERIYGGSPVAQVYNKLLRQTVSEALRSHTSDRPLRILEIGAGTGATTTSVVSLLTEQAAHYTFTDISPLFLERARAKFSGFPNMSYEYLNIEENLLEQGFSRGSYDVVIAANIFHATRDLRETLTHVNQLLAPGGLVLMLEGTQPQAWVDMTFGLTEGWWRFSDQDLRSHYPLIDQTQWLELLSETGFTASVPLGFNDASGQTVILGQKSLAEAEIILSSTIDWLIFADGNAIGSQLVDQFAIQGQRAALVVRDSLNLHRDSRDVFYLNDLQPLAFTQLLQQPSLESLKGLIYIGGWGWSASQNSAQAAENDTTSLLMVLQALSQRNGVSSPAVWVITAGAQPVDGKVADPSMAALWGLGRVLALEHPQGWGGLIDLDPDAPDAAQVVQEIVSSDDEDQVAYRSGERHVARLIRTRSTQPEAIRFDSNASYLITGGLGGLGLNIAAWMAEHGACHLTLLSRSAMPDRESWDALPANSDLQRRAEGILALETLGVQVNIHAANVGDYDQMAELFARFGSELPPMKGIIHAAAALSNAPIVDMPLDLVASQFGAKVSGVVVLDQLARDIELDFFVVFSSTTALWGVRELGHYAAANTFLDAFVYDQRARGIPAFSINWGIWEEMRIASVEERAAVAQYGLKPMPSDQALGILGDILTRAAMTQITIASVDWKLLKPAYEARRRHPLLEYMGDEAVHDSLNGAHAQAPSLVASLETALPEERLSIILEHVAGVAAAVLGASRPDMLDVYQGLFDMGMDSLMSVELKTRLEKGVGRSLPSTVTFNYPTIAELADYLLSTLFPVEAAVQSIPEIPVEENVPMDADDMDDFSEEELADLLMKKLKGLQ